MLSSVRGARHLPKIHRNIILHLKHRPVRADGLGSSPVRHDGQHHAEMNKTSAASMPRETKVLVLHCFLSFVICSIDRINLSVAIIPMSDLFSWSPSQQGLIQSIFFVGYMLTMVLGGRLADRYGGRNVLIPGVVIWSICTFLIPFVASNLPLLLLVRILLGAGEGVAMPSMNSLVAVAVPVHFRARSLALIYSGMYAGSVLGLIFTPPLLSLGGYPAAFYVYAGCGILWAAVFAMTVPSRPGRANEDGEVSEADGLLGRCQEEEEEEEGERPSIWQVLRYGAVWAIIIAHFCCTWGYFVLVAWMPTYLYSRFSLDVSSSSFLSALPWTAMFVSSNVGGVFADMLLRHSNLSLTKVRKVSQGIAFVGPSILLGILPIISSAWIAVAILALALSLAAFSNSGVYANHQDIGPGIAGMLLGISSTFASIPGLVGVWVTGVVVEMMHGQWWAVLDIAVAFYLIGFVAFSCLGTAKRIW